MISKQKIIDALAAFKDVKAFFSEKYSRKVPNVTRFFTGVDLGKKGIHYACRYTHPELYSKHFIIDFSNYLDSFSNNSIQVDAVNAYTLGCSKKDPVGRSQDFKKVSNIYDPFSKFKDSWFGCYFIFDDVENRGRNFLLKDPNGRPDDLNNIKESSLLKLVETDQKLITWSSHDGEPGYTREKHDQQFYFNKFNQTTVSRVYRNNDEEWIKIEGTFKTTSILPDINTTNMNLFTSNRCYTGLPSWNVFDFLDPWHEIILHGVSLCRYYDFRKVKFWPNIYYCAVEYSDKKGERINNWMNSDAIEIFEKMFHSIEIESIK